MTQKNVSKEVISDSQIKAEKPSRKGMRNYIRVYLFLPYVSGLIAILLLGIALIELFDVSNSTFISGFEAFHYSLLFAIFSMVSRMYYKMFVGHDDKK